MKILQFIPYFNPKMGGDVNVCYNLSKELEKRGHQVTILTTDFEYDKSYAQSLENVKVVPCQCIAHYGLFLYSPAIKNWLKNNLCNFDVIHLHTYRSYQNNLIQTYARKYGISYVLQPHGSLPRLVKKQCLKKLYDIVWGNNILQNADGIIALTSNEAKQVIKMGIKKNKIHIIANGIDLSQHKTIPLYGSFRSIYNIPSNAHVILYLGRLHPIKGVDLLIRAFDVISKNNDNCILVITGPDDGSLPSLKVITKKLNLCSKIIFTGPLYGKEKCSAYNDCDVYVLPSLYEAFPITVLEAWSFKKPVIITENCGIKDLVQNSGQVVQSNLVDLTNALTNYIQQDSLRISHGQNGYNKLHEELSMKTTVYNIENLYTDLIVL